MGEKEGFLPYPVDYETLCVHHTKKLSKDIDKLFMPAITTSNIVQASSSKSQPQTYVSGRSSNPIRCALENLMCLLNKGKYALTFASGMGAISAVLGLLKCGDEIVCSDEVYGGTFQILDQLLPKFGMKASFMDFYDLEKLEKCLTPKTKLIWIENPTNPSMKVIDIVKTTEIAKKRNIICAVDNTFLTPYLQRPLELGADISMQSVTKYLNGHSDVIMGSICTNRQDLYNQLKCIQTHYGHVPSPYDCYQVIRGIKTLPIRLKRHHINSLQVAKFLIDHPKVENVKHPAHPSHPKHELFKKQTSGHSGMISFYVKGKHENALQFMKCLNLFACAVSLGGYESLVQPPYYLTHKGVSDDLKKKLKITPNMIRLSIGLENVEDLIEDLKQSLDKLPTTVCN